MSRDWICAANLPDALEMHRSDFDDMTHLLTLQDAIATTSSHASNVEQFRTIDHVIVYKRVSRESRFSNVHEAHSISLMRLHAVSRTITSSNADALRLYLEAHAPLVFPQRSCYPGLHAWRCDLARSIVHWLWVTLCRAQSSAVCMGRCSSRTHCYKLSVEFEREEDEDQSLPGNGSIAEFICEPMDDGTECPADWGEATPF